MVELAFSQSGGVAGTGGGEDVIGAVVVDVFAVCMAMAGKDGVRPVGEQGNEPVPIVHCFALPPEGLVHEQQGPSGVTAGFEDVLEVGHLLVADAGGRRVLGIEADEQDVSVVEVIVGWAEALLPYMGPDLIGDIVVAGEIEEGHAQFVDERVKFVPFAIELVLVFGITFDEVADGEDELGLEEVELFDGAGEDAWSMVAGSVGEDGELEIIGIIVQVQMCPGIGFSGDVDSEAGVGLWFCAAGRENDGGSAEENF
jgi:hypothetical protein